MIQEITSPLEGEGTGPSQTPGAVAPPDNEESGTTSDGRVFTQEQVDLLVKQRLAEEKRRAQKKAEEDRAREQGEWQKLCETREAELQELRVQLQREAIRTLRLQVSHKVGLPEVLQERLQGETLEELEADAVSLMEAIRSEAKPAASIPPGLPAVNPARSREKTRPPGIVRLEDISWG